VTAPGLAAIREVDENRAAGPVPLWVQPEWGVRFPWLVQGTTGAGDARAFDLGLFGGARVAEVVDRWRLVRQQLDMPASLHARQVHGADLQVYEMPMPPGLFIGEGVDGHLTRRPGLLLAVSVADCVPVFLVDAGLRAVAAVHAGWRGVAEMILERTIERMRGSFGSEIGELWVHLGPSICGACYEVGPEVHRAVWPDSASPAGPQPIDLRRALAARALAQGVPAEQVSVSTLCTRCGGAAGAGTADAFFSHRGGATERQVGLIGIR
jgi:polyphenol oxidase